MVKASSNAPSFWEVVGGGDKGGIVVRTGKDVTSAMTAERLSTGALLKELELDGERLHYESLRGTGPNTGWVSLRLQSGKDLVLPVTGVWEVVGGEDKGGILVRTGKDKASAEAPGRLSFGAFVRELGQEGDRLHFQRLTGSGPDTGWVSMKLATGKDLVVPVGTGTPVEQLLKLLHDHHDSTWFTVAPFLEKMEDADLATLKPELVKLTKDTSLQLELKTRSVRRKAMRLLVSMGEAEPLADLLEDEDLPTRCAAAIALGSLGGDACTPYVRKLADMLASDKEWRGRCWAARILGRLGEAAAPAAAALRKGLDDGDADVREAAAAALRGLGEVPGAYPQDPHPEQVCRPAGPVVGRKPCVLAVHGTPSNSAVMQMMSAKLKATLGKDFVWKFVDSPMDWQAIPGSRDPLYTEPTDLEKQLAKGKPFTWWYAHGNGIYSRVDEGVANLRKLVEEAQPVDVIVSFSQGSNCISLLLDSYRREGIEVPWKLSVFFCGGQIDDEIWWFKKDWKSSQPTVRVFNALEDPWFGGAEAPLDFMYTDLIELGQNDGHGFPSTPPRAAEVYNQVASEIRRHVGLTA